MAGLVPATHANGRGLAKDRTTLRQRPIRATFEVYGLFEIGARRPP
ncbi:hypothetical protein MJC1_00665 [Methylocystis sp. MJC1]|nr:hypothetical protein MJC1_00665 [Methylocystis sp. MJC1]